VSQPTDTASKVAPTPDLVTLTIDDVPVSVPKGTLIIRAAEMIGTAIPRFCDHPLLDPVGACRQCLGVPPFRRQPATAQLQIFRPRLQQPEQGRLPGWRGVLRCGGHVRRRGRQTFGRRRHVVPTPMLHLQQPLTDQLRIGAGHGVQAELLALRHLRIHTSRPIEPQGDSRDITRHIAQLVRAHSPNFGKARDLPVSSR